MTTPGVARYLVQPSAGGTQQSLASTWTDVGYFYYTSPTVYNTSTNWYSLKAHLQTSNGIMITNDAGGPTSSPPTSSTAGFKLGSAGVYRLNYALDITGYGTTGTGNFYYGLGMQYLSNTTTGALPTTNTFIGSPVTIEAYTLSARNQTYPAILNWTAEGYSASGSSASFGVFTRINNYLMYLQALRGASGGYTAPYISSGSITFAVKDPSQTIYFQVSSNTGCTIGYCPFNIELLTTTVPTVPSDPNA